MMPTTWRSRNVADALTKQAYGLSPKEMDAALTNTIVQLFSKLKMTVEQIAEITKIEASAILLLLKKHKLITK
jgi:predicted transcriptional regulator